MPEKTNKGRQGQAQAAAFYYAQGEIPCLVAHRILMPRPAATSLKDAMVSSKCFWASSTVRYMAVPTQILVAYGLIIIVYSSEIAIGGGLKIILDISGINIRYTASLGRNQKLDSAVGPCAGTSLCRRSRICFGFCRSCCFLRRCSCGGAVCRRTAG